MNRVQDTGAARILVVDDMPANVQLLTRMLSIRGYVMQSVSSGAEALLAMRDTPPDLILLDINMPVMNGYEVCACLKANPDWCAIPVIFLSALHEVTDKVAAFAAGGVDYVTKPFQLEEVYARVDTHVNLRMLQRRLARYNEELEMQVVQRTAELAAACARVQDLSRLKGDFLSMISNEMRTPANGLLGFGELLISLCPPSDGLDLYASLFEQSRDRLVGLLNDVSLISQADAMAQGTRLAVRFSDVMDQVRGSLPGLHITLDAADLLREQTFDGAAGLLVRALKTVVQLGAAFSVNILDVHLVAEATDQGLCLRLALDRLSLSEQQAQAFFLLATSVRAVSTAEMLGLAPVVAQQILRAFGGDVKLLKGEGYSGTLEVCLQRAAVVEAVL